VWNHGDSSRSILLSIYKQALFYKQTYFICFYILPEYNGPCLQTVFILYKVHVGLVVLCISEIFCVCDVTSGSNFVINYNYRRPLVPVILLQEAMYPSLHFFF